MPSQLLWTVGWEFAFAIYLFILMTMYIYKIEWFENWNFTLIVGLLGLAVFAGNQLSLSKKDIIEEDEMHYEKQ